LVRPLICPDTTETAPNSPAALAVVSITPVQQRPFYIGERNVPKGFPAACPRVSAASSSAVPWASIKGISSLATNGRVTNNVAITIPGGAKIIFIPKALSSGPKVRDWC